MSNFTQSSGALLDLEIAKILARQILLAEEPQLAQSIANQTLYPDLWTREAAPAWIDRIPQQRRVFTDFADDFADDSNQGETSHP